MGESDEKLYEFKIEFFEEVDVEVSELANSRHPSGISLGWICSSSSRRRARTGSIGPGSSRTPKSSRTSMWIGISMWMRMRRPRRGIRGLAEGSGIPV